MKSLLLMLGLFFAANLQAMEEPVTVPSVKFVKTSQEIAAEKWQVRKSAEKWQVRKEVVIKRLVVLTGLLVPAYAIGTHWEFKKYKEIEINLLKTQRGTSKAKRDIFKDAAKKNLPILGIALAVFGGAAVLIPPVYIKGKFY